MMTQRNRDRLFGVIFGAVVAFGASASASYDTDTNLCDGTFGDLENVIRGAVPSADRIGTMVEKILDSCWTPGDGGYFMCRFDRHQAPAE